MVSRAARAGRHHASFNETKPEEPPGLAGDEPPEHRVDHLRRRNHRSVLVEMAVVHQMRQAAQLLAIVELAEGVQ